jgi:hypothetical protein
MSCLLNVRPPSHQVVFVIDQFPDEKLKNFKFDMSKGPQRNIDLMPPPRWSHVKIPFNYSLVIKAPA